MSSPRIAAGIVIVFVTLALAPAAGAATRVYFAANGFGLPGTAIFFVDLDPADSTPTATLVSGSGVWCPSGTGQNYQVTGLAVDTPSSLTSPTLYHAGQTNWDGTTCGTTSADNRAYIAEVSAGATVVNYLDAFRSGSHFSGLGYDSTTGRLMTNGVQCTSPALAYCLFITDTGGSGPRQESGIAATGTTLSASAGYAMATGSGGKVVKYAPLSPTTTRVDFSGSAGLPSASGKYGLAVEEAADLAYFTDNGTVESIPLGTTSSTPTVVATLANARHVAVLADGSPIAMTGSTASVTVAIEVLSGPLAGTYSPQYGSAAMDGGQAMVIVEPPDEAAAPAVTGTATPGSTLTCDDSGSWAADLSAQLQFQSPVAAATTYQWYRDGVAISGANAATYATAPATFGVYACEAIASNVAGSTTSSRGSLAIATLPGAPTGVTATGGAESATISWSAPSADGYSAILSYTVTASPSSKTCTATAPETTCTVSDLDAGVAYTFTVTATNSVGTGAASTASGAVTPTTDPGPSPRTPTAPSAPTGATATAGLLKATVSWTAPSSDGGTAITSYTATANPGGKTCTATATSCTITGLPNTRAYTFTVTATNAAGTSPASTATNKTRPYKRLAMRKPRAEGTRVSSAVRVTGAATITQTIRTSTNRTACTKRIRAKRKKTYTVACPLNRATRNALKKRRQTLTVTTTVLTRKGATFQATHRIRVSKTR